ncbi:MAG: leucine-rich repeat domain-containing protein [Bacteroidales bacterium]|nr:leucine-rich repeat domain-containing protein [Bacteroidales bacterium]
MNDLSQAKLLIKECQETQNTYLDIGNCGITNLNDLPELFECTHLETLILSNYWWEGINGKIMCSKNLGVPNSINLLSIAFEFLVNLKKIIFSCNNYKLSVDILSNCKNLEYLDLRNSIIRDFSWINKLTELKYLFLGINGTTDISFLESLKGLLTLDISDNSITDISYLKNLKELKYLNISTNQVSDCSSISNLINLQYLELGRNKINNIGFLEKLTNLQTLDLCFNQITDISFLKNLTNLQTLDLKENQITDISSLEKLSALHSLRLDYNQITDISSLSKLKDLQKLNFCFNQITDIGFIKKLPSLQTLDICFNQVKNIPLSFFQLNMDINMKDSGGDGLCLCGNPIESPPLEIIKQGKQAVFDWFEATKIKLNEIKIILIGEPKAGKTSLLKRLKYDTFNKDEVQTDGVNIEDIEFGKCETFKEQPSLQSITGHFWDFGGQEIMNATHQFFLTKRSVYVLVLHSRNDAKNSSQVREWVKRVRATGGDSPIIVLANQIDVNPGFGFENERELQDEFPQIKCFIKASCSTNENIDLFKEKLAELIPTAELFKTEIDERWIAIKENLQEKTKADYFLDETLFKTICNTAKIDENRKQKDAISFLHDLGLVLHFDDLDLADYYVLNPYWSTYGVYQILTSSYAGNMKGIVGMNKLEFIVNDEKDKIETYNPANYKKITYSHNQRRFLIDILHQYKLCFCTADKSQFIIPDLLDTKEPMEVTDPIRLSEEKIQFIYDYDYLPKSIMPNIMVETHHLIKEMWRTGCMLQYGDSKALITSYDNRIEIIITGEHKMKREFMAVIRHLLEKIHQKLSNKPTTLIPLPGVKAFAEYERLLARERKGKKNYIFDEDKPTEKEFQISDLLDGIPNEEEVKNSEKIFQEKLFSKLDKMQCGIDEIKSDTTEIKNKLNSHYEYLINLPSNSQLKECIDEAMQTLNTQQTTQILSEIMKYFEAFNDVLDDELRGILEALKKTDDVQMKLKLSIPFINMLGINFETEFNVKSWAKKMYKKYEFKLFQLLC